MLVLIGVLTLVGTFLEIIPAMILCIPIMQPIVKLMGFDPVHFGTVVIMTLLIGSLTPPVGLVAMLACRIAGIPYNSAMVPILLYTALLTVVTIVVAMFPALIMWLPGMMR
jgi:TRAP-type C4-dicarboxylate transport system permease large subunit